MDIHQNELKKSNVAIDITKLIMAFLVVAIHTEPFGFSFWLDKGFGIVTRLCVPFFFVASSYFFFSKNQNPLRYIKRIALLYLVWSLIYLPFDLPALSTMTPWRIVFKYFWLGNNHALWYLCGSLVGFSIVYGLSKIVSPKKILVLSILFLLIGCLKSTYAPVLAKFLVFQFSDYLGSRNGLFYAFAYYAIGLFIAEKNVSFDKPQKKHVLGVAISFMLLCIESLVLVLVFKTQATILWLSVLPLTYNFFMIVKDLRIPLDNRISYFIRKCSTGIYVSHCLFMYLFSNLHYWKSFLVVSITATIFSVFVIVMSKKRGFTWMKYLF